MLPRKFMIWLKKTYPAKKRGKRTEAALHLGLDQGYVSRLYTGDSFDVSLSNLGRLAKAAGFASTWQLLREIETEEIDRHGGAVVDITERNRLEWESVLAGDPVRAQRITMVLKHVEALRYTEMLVEVARLVIDMGPKAATMPVAKLLDEFDEKPSSAVTKLRRKLTAEFEAL